DALKMGHQCIVSTQSSMLCSYRLYRFYTNKTVQNNRSEQHPANRGELQVSHRLFSLGETVRGLPTTLDHFLRDQPDFIEPGSLGDIDHARHFSKRQGPVALHKHHAVDIAKRSEEHTSELQSR